MELVADAENHVFLQVCQVEFAVNLAIHALAGLAPDGDDGGVGLLHFVGHAAVGNLNLVQFWLSLVQEPHHGVLVGLQLGLGIFYVVLVNLGEEWGSAHTHVLQSLHHVDHVGHVDGPRAKSAREEIVAVHAEKSHGLQVADGQCPRVLQQHHAFGSALAGDGSMGFQVGLVGVFVATEAWRLHDVLQHVAHITVYVFHVQPAGFHRLDDVLHLGGIAGHHQVVAGTDLLLHGQRLALADPVGHDDAVEAPLPAQNVGQHVLVALRIDTINNIVG